jgi:hypothetical protein
MLNFHNESSDHLLRDIIKFLINFESQTHIHQQLPNKVSVFWDIALSSLKIIVSCLAYCSSLKMEMICSSVKLFDSQQAAWHYIPDNRALRSHH